MNPLPQPAPAADAVGSAFRLPRRPKAVVFDLDGTLIDSEAFVRAAWFAAAPQFGVALTQAHFLSFVGKHRAATEALMLGYFGDAFPLADFFAEITAEIGESIAPLKPGAARLLDCLDGLRTPYAVATSSGRPWVDRHFAHHNLHARFRGIITRDDVENRKPHPEPYLKAAGLLGYAPADVLAIEDSPTGIRSAHDAGMMALLIPDLIQPDDETRAHALYVGTSLNDVLQMLQP